VKDGAKRSGKGENKEVREEETVVVEEKLEVK
jgi:hypothetical protein